MTDILELISNNPLYTGYTRSILKLNNQRFVLVSDHNRKFVTVYTDNDELEDRILDMFEYNNYNDKELHIEICDLANIN